MRKNIERTSSIKNFLIPVLLVAILFPLILLGIFSYIKTENILLKSFEENSVQMTNQINSNLEVFVKDLGETVDTFSKNEDFALLIQGQEGQLPPYTTKEALDKFAQKKLEDLKKSDEDIRFVYLGSRNKVMFSNEYGEEKGEYDPTSRPWYKQAVENKNKVAIIDPYLDSKTQKLNFTLAKSIEDKSGNILGVFGIDVSLDQTSTKYKNAKIGQSGKISIIGKNNIMISSSESAKTGKEVKNEDYFGVINGKENGFEKYSSNGKTKYVAFQTNKITGWKIVASFEESEVKVYLNSVRNFTIFIMAIASLMAIAFSVFITKKVTAPLNKLKTGIDRAALGDLSRHIDMKDNDEFGQIGKAFDRMIDNIKNLLNEIKESSNTVKDTALGLSQMTEQTTVATGEVAKTIDDIAANTNEQAAQNMEGAEKLDILSGNIDQISKSIENITQMFNESNDLNKKGISTVDSLTLKTEETKLEGDKVSSVVCEVDNSAQEVGDIINAITEIADQTNLLALNASIEAARAGEAGKGFAVVADEIRNLAENSKDAADKIKVIILDIQNKSKNAVESIKNNNLAVDEQAKAVVETKHIFNQISEKILEVSNVTKNIKSLNDNMVGNKDVLVDIITNISASAEETSASTEQVSTNTEEILSTIENLNDNSQRLNELAGKLKEEVEKFKTE